MLTAIRPHIVSVRRMAGRCLVGLLIGVIPVAAVPAAAVAADREPAARSAEDPPARKARGHRHKRNKQAKADNAAQTPAVEASDPLANGKRWHGMWDDRKFSVTVTARTAARATLKLHREGGVVFVFDVATDGNRITSVERAARHSKGRVSVANNNRVRISLNGGQLRIDGEASFNMGDFKNNSRKFGILASVGKK